MDTSGFDNSECHNPNLDAVPWCSTVQKIVEELQGLINGSSPRDTVAMLDLVDLLALMTARPVEVSEAWAVTTAKDADIALFANRLAALDALENGHDRRMVLLQVHGKAPKRKPVPAEVSEFVRVKVHGDVQDPVVSEVTVLVPNDPIDPPSAYLPDNPDAGVALRNLPGKLYTIPVYGAPPQRVDHCEMKQEKDDEIFKCSGCGCLDQIDTVKELAAQLAEAKLKEPTGVGPTHVWVAEYWPPYRSTGRYTPYVYLNEPKALKDVKWVKVPVRTEEPEG